MIRHHLVCPGAEVAPAVEVALDWCQISQGSIVLVEHNLEQDVVLLVLVEYEQDCGSHRNVIVLEPVFGIFGLGWDGAHIVYIQKSRQSFNDVIVPEAQMSGLVGIAERSLSLGYYIF